MYLTDLFGSLKQLLHVKHAGQGEHCMWWWSPVLTEPSSRDVIGTSNSIESTVSSLRFHIRPYSCLSPQLRALRGEL